MTYEPADLSVHREYSKSDIFLIDYVLIYFYYILILALLSIIAGQLKYVFATVIILLFWPFVFIYFTWAFNGLALHYIFIFVPILTIGVLYKITTLRKIVVTVLWMLSIAIIVGFAYNII